MYDNKLSRYHEYNLFINTTLSKIANSSNLVGTCSNMGILKVRRRRLPGHVVLSRGLKIDFVIVVLTVNLEFETLFGIIIYYGFWQIF